MKKQLIQTPCALAVIQEETEPSSSTECSETSNQGKSLEHRDLRQITYSSQDTSELNNDSEDPSCSKSASISSEQHVQGMSKEDISQFTSSWTDMASQVGKLDDSEETEPSTPGGLTKGRSIDGSATSCSQGGDTSATTSGTKTITVSFGYDRNLKLDQSEEHKFRKLEKSLCKTQKKIQNLSNAHYDKIGQLVTLMFQNEEQAFTANLLQQKQSSMLVELNNLKTVNNALKKRAGVAKEEAEAAQTQFQEAVRNYQRTQEALHEHSKVQIIRHQEIQNTLTKVSYKRKEHKEQMIKLDNEISKVDDCVRNQKKKIDDAKKYFQNKKKIQTSTQVKNLKLKDDIREAREILQVRIEQLRQVENGWNASEELLQDLKEEIKQLQEKTDILQVKQENGWWFLSYNKEIVGKLQQEQQDLIQRIGIRKGELQQLKKVLHCRIKEHQDACGSLKRAKRKLKDLSATQKNQ